MALSNFEMACMAFYAEHVDSDDVILKAQDNPEAYCMMKETFDNLSVEAKVMLSAILTLPDEMFDSTGRVIARELVSWMKRRYKWSARLIKKTRLELATTFGANV